MRRSSVLALILALLLLTGCLFPVLPTESSEPAPETTEAPTEAPAYSYEKIYVAGLTEPLGHSLLLSSGAAQTTAGGHTYEFELSIPEEERAAFIAAQETLCAYLKEQHVNADSITFRVLADYACRSDSENGVAYFGMEALQTWEQVLVTLQSVWGDYTNYGYLYALGSHIASELGWETKEGKAAPAVFEENPTLLNLVYPCFSQEFSSNQEIAACRSMAISILTLMGNPYMGEYYFMAAAEDYATEEGIDFEPTYLGFAYNGSCSALKIRTKYAEVAFNSAVVLAEEEDLDLIISCYEYIDRELDWRCKFFDHSPDRLVPVELCGEDLSYGGTPYEGYYNSRDGSMQIYYATSIIDLYTYEFFNLYGDSNAENWHIWAVMQFLSSEIDCDDLYYYYMNDDEWKAYIEGMIGGEFTDYSDFFRYHDALVHLMLPASPKKELYNGNTYSFVGYFTERYGVDAFLQVMLHTNQSYKLTGKSLDSIVNGWCSYIENEVEVDESKLSPGYDT